MCTSRCLHSGGCSFSPSASERSNVAAPVPAADVRLDLQAVHSSACQMWHSSGPFRKLVCLGCHSMCCVMPVSGHITGCLPLTQSNKAAAQFENEQPAGSPGPCWGAYPRPGGSAALALSHSVPGAAALPLVAAPLAEVLRLPAPEGPAEDWATAAAAVAGCELHPIEWELCN